MIPNGTSHVRRISGSTGKIDTALKPDGKAVAMATAPPPIVRTGGPRTLQGKQRSSQNAIKRGFFAKASFIKGESRAEFNHLSKNLYESLQPVGAFEELEVDRIVSTLWQMRRTLRAEAAEIEFEKEYGERPGQLIKFHFGDLFRSLDRIIGPNMDDQDRKGAIALLQALKMCIEMNGFDVKNDNLMLAELYGKQYPQQDWDRDIREYYRSLAAIASLPEDIRNRQQLPSPAECRIQFVKILSDLEEKFTRENEERNAVDYRRIELESLRRGVPDSPRLDSILRSNTRLERSLDRGLSRLERFQAKRLGQPVLPPIKLDISSS